MTKKKPTIPPVSDFRGFQGDKEAIELIRTVLMKHPADVRSPEAIMEAAAQELKMFLFSRVKFYPDFETTDGGKWLGLRFNHGPDFLLLVQKDVPLETALIGIYCDDTAVLQKKEQGQIARTMHFALKSANQELDSK